MFKRLLRLFVIDLPVIFVVVSLAWVLVFKWAPVKYTPLMLKRAIEFSHDPNYSTKQKWVKIEDVAQTMKTAVMMCEDARFYSHRGFDWIEIQRAVEIYKTRCRYEGRRLPLTEIYGCSTISQQVAKNCFTFCNRTIFRKAIEAYYTVLIEYIWGKERILEVYMNIAELGYGIYGVGQAAEHYYRKDVSKLSVDEACAIALVLPNPLHSTPQFESRSEPRFSIVRREVATACRK